MLGVLGHGAVIREDREGIEIGPAHSGSFEEHV